MNNGAFSVEIEATFCRKDNKYLEHCCRECAHGCEPFSTELPFGRSTYNKKLNEIIIRMMFGG